MSQAGASLLLVAVMFGLAVYLVIWPPPGFDENLAYRASIPFVLIATAYGVLENLRTRAHMGQLIGALRVTAADDLFVISKLSKIIRFQAAEVSTSEGTVQGVNCMTLRGDEAAAVVGSGKAVSD